MGNLTRNSGVQGGDFENVPEGKYQAVVCDVIDLGWQEAFHEGKSKGLRPMIKMVYQTKKLREADGKPYLVFGRKQTVSMHDNAGLRKELSGILGRKELDRRLDAGSFDTEELIGVNVRLKIEESEREGRTYSNITQWFEWDDEDGPIIEVRDYVRRDAREDYTPPAVSAFDDINAPSHKNGNAQANGSAPTTGTQSSIEGTLPTELMAEINAEASAIWGEDCDADLNSIKKDVCPGVKWKDVTEAQGKTILGKLKKLRQPMPKRMEPVYPAEDDFDDSDPFADQ